MSEVSLGIWVGQMSAAEDTAGLQRRGITGVLNSSGMPSDAAKKRAADQIDVEYLDLDVLDMEDSDILSHLPASVQFIHCLLYTSDAADEEDSVDLGGRRIIKKKKK
eukprot:TRINITY_DN65097_c0_g1_i1.p2 TRINITY_DN65097_c0_g1~~TRINITY_DN65097_c0_g1_i1.p2  ORF type:complete len:107 (-),score=41.40 TRINITY_DN65097_c0_g1_i1:88-408(-)